MITRRIAVAAFTTIGLAGCAGAASTAGSRLPAVQSQAGAAFAPDRSGAGTATGAGLTTSIVVGTPSDGDIERSVRATYTVPAGSFLTSFEGAIGRAVGLGGYVVSSSTQPNGSGRIVSGSVTLKVPAARVAEFLNGMPPTFVASSIDFSSIDHTAQFVDLNARLASAHAHLAALDGLLAKATSIGEITTLEQEIESVQTEIDTDQGEVNALTASVELATASIRMSERGTRVAPVAPPNPVAGGVGSGWGNAVTVTGAALEGLVSGLPLLVVLAAGLVVWRRLPRTATSRRRSSE